MGHIQKSQLRLGTAAFRSLARVHQLVTHVPHDMFLVFPTRGLGEVRRDSFVSQPKHVDRSFVPTQCLTNPGAQLVAGRSRFARLVFEVRTHHLAVSVVSDAHHTGLGDGGMNKQALLDFEREDVLTT